MTSVTACCFPLLFPHFASSLFNTCTVIASHQASARQYIYTKAVQFINTWCHYFVSNCHIIGGYQYPSKALTERMDDALQFFFALFLFFCIFLTPFQLTSDTLMNALTALGESIIVVIFVCCIFLGDVDRCYAKEIKWPWNVTTMDDVLLLTTSPVNIMHPLNQNLMFHKPVYYIIYREDQKFCSIVIIF